MKPNGVISALLVGSILLSLGCATKAFAQASIAAENNVDEVVFTYKDAAGADQKTSVSLVRDAREANQWYYIPGAPMLVTTKSGANTVPQFTLVQYDYRDTDNPQTINRAGLLNFSARLSLPPEALPALKAAALDVLGPRLGDGVASQIRISALPINSATVSLFSSDGKLAGRADGTGTAPTFAAQQMAFSLPLTNVGVEVYDALTNSATGVPIVVQYTYNGLTPPAGFKVKINYRTALEHYSSDEQFKARASYYGWVSANVSSQRASIRDELINSGAIEVTMFDGGAFDPARLDAYLQPILKRINDQVLENTRPPAPVTPAAAQAPNADGFFGGAGYSVATKSVSQLKVLTEEIDFRQQSIVERTTIVGGFIGIGNYPEDVRNALKITVDGTASPSAYVAFPSIPPSIQRVQLEVSLEAHGTKFAMRTYVHELNGSWTDLANGKVADRIGFSLAAIEQKFGKAALDEAQFSIRKTISTINDSLTFTDSSPATEGATAVSLQDNVAGLQLRGSQLTFRQMGGDLVRMELSVNSGGREKSYAFEAINVNGAWQPPPDEYFLMPDTSAGSPVTLTAKLVFVDRSKNRTAPTQTLTLQNGFVPVYLDNFIN